MQIDGVFSGGGMKAIAFAGALEVVEEQNIQFNRVAGTSAGALMAAFVAAGYNSEEIMELLEHLDTKKFLDAPKTPFMFLKWLRLYWQLGLYKGDELEDWIGVQLRAKGIETFADLKAGKLRIITSDLTRGEILVIPDDLHKYGLHAKAFSVAKAVRMSCSLPYFFQPVKLFSTKGEKSIIVDGGVLSNFPVWLFMEERKRPVLGFKLSPNPEHAPKHQVHNALDMYHALFATMKDAHDARYISKSVEKNIVFIPVSSAVTTEFDLSEEDKQGLIKLGRKRTEDFLRHWSY